MVIKGYRYKGWGILRNTERSGSCYQETFFFNSRLGVSLRSRKSSGEILSALKAFSNFTHSSSLDEAVPPALLLTLEHVCTQLSGPQGDKEGGLWVSLVDAREDFWDTFHFLVRNDDELSCDVTQITKIMRGTCLMVDFEWEWWHDEWMRIMPMDWKCVGGVKGLRRERN